MTGACWHSCVRSRSQEIFHKHAANSDVGIWPSRPASPENLDFEIASQTENIQLDLFTNAGLWKPVLVGGPTLAGGNQRGELETNLLITQEPDELWTNGDDRCIKRAKPV